jgi:tellurite resistance protein TerC
MDSIGSPGLWLGFTSFVLVMLALDLGVFHRKAHKVGVREALAWSGVWIGLALLFNLGVYHWYGPEKGLEFLTGYLIEKALSVDNIFVFLMLFSYFAVPSAYQHRVLFWGIFGALVMRAIFIAAGAALLSRFHWVIYIFGGLLVVTAVKMLRSGGAHEIRPERNQIYRMFQRYVPSVEGYRQDRFLVRVDGRWVATPLLAVLVAVEATDLVFAVDSIPAIFAVTSDPFIVYTSNIFAILGLRAMFFLLAGVMDKFEYLKVGLALVLGFVGTKMLLTDIFKIPIEASLGAVAALIAGSVVLSILRPSRNARSSRAGDADTSAA